MFGHPLKGLDLENGSKKLNLNVTTIKPNSITAKPSFTRIILTPKAEKMTSKVSPKAKMSDDEIKEEFKKQLRVQKRIYLFQG